MTTDAKVGLLLGLIFIFVVAFIVNGLPSLMAGKNNNELTTNMVVNHTKALAIQERKANREIITQTKFTPQPAEDKTRYQAPLPTVVSNNEHSTPEPIRASVSPTASQQIKNLVAKTQIQKATALKQSLPMYYTVQKGDNLAEIAIKFYGSEKGNKRKNVERIFEVNKETLDSPDDIFVGQKLIIPPLTSKQRNNETSNIFNNSMFKPIDKIGQRKTNHHDIYIVKEGDSLWDIADEQLGNGNRFNEIIKANSDILSDEDNLQIGMRLKIPAQ